MNGFLDFVYQFLPILIGAAVMLAFRSVNVIRHRMRIDISNDFALIQEEAMQGEPGDPIRDIMKARFEREAMERLIAEGLLSGRESGKNISVPALERLGMADLRDLELICEKGWPGKNMTIAVRSMSELEDRLCKFDKTSGVLLAHMIDCRLSILEIRASE